jgi:hypothetical protein
MVGTLSEFLSRHASEARPETSDREAVLAEWKDAVEALIDQMEIWLKEADPNRLLRYSRTVHSIREPRLGTYTVPGLRIWFGTRAIDVEPIARYPIGSMLGDSLGRTLRGGQVDLGSIGHRYMLYRKVGSDGAMTWIMVSDQDYREQPLDREHFEEAVKRLLE